MKTKKLTVAQARRALSDAEASGRWTPNPYVYAVDRPGERTAGCALLGLCLGLGGGPARRDLLFQVLEEGVLSAPADHEALVALECAYMDRNSNYRLPRLRAWARLGAELRQRQEEEGLVDLDLVHRVLGPRPVVEVDGVV